MSSGGDPTGPSGPAEKSGWDDVPDAIEVDLTQLSEPDRMALLKNHIDEAKANQLIARMDGSAADYESNMRRINNVLGWLNFAMDGAIRVGKIIA